MIERRIGLLFACFMLLLCVAIARAGWMQGIQGGTLSDDAQSQHTQTVAIPGQRGRILDRNGRELAVSEEAADVVATPYQVKDPAEVSRRLAQLLDVSKSEILRALADRSAGFAYIARQVDLATATRVRKLVLDGMGKEIERETLNGADHGEDLQLSIDAGIQAQTEKVLANVGLTYHPRDATAIVMDPRNARVLAMADWPSFDQGKLSSTSPQDLRNTATGFTYEPGSTFKAFTVAAALSEHLVTPNTVFDLPVEIQVADRTISDSHPRGPVSL